jgi:thiamine biosynthesis lipoprotein
MDEKRRKKLLWQLPFLAVLIVGTVLIIHQQRSMPYQHNEGMVFGTFYKITYQCDSDLHASIGRELQRVDCSLSPFNKESVITSVNENRSVVLDDMFLDVFRLAMKISDDTDGAFDITVAPLVNAWGFGFKSGVKPTQQVVDSLRQMIGYKKVRITDGRVVKDDPRIMLDCSAIAKGYGADVVARLLDRRGVTNYMVEIGGEVVTRGISPKRLPWKIGVTKPVDDSLSVSGELQTVLNVTDLAMATSGNYRNFYYRDGKKYAHTIDPKTGYPVQHSILSATVLTRDCATADAYATSFMVMGLERARQVLDRHPELMAYFIYADAEGQNLVWFSPSLKNKIEE